MAAKGEGRDGQADATTEALVRGGKTVEKFDIFQDIAERTGGDIYIGVVGPVRTGKSTLIKRFMNQLVLPNIADENDRQRAIDALPQSAGGRSIMTTEPKFIPDDGVSVQFKEQISFKVRFVDCVGYQVAGALGYEEMEGVPRLVESPWYEEPVPFEQAAEVGTRKVISDHSTIGLVVTTDGSFGELPRDAYVPAEERVVEELRDLGKPFIVILNSSRPYDPQTVELAGELEHRYDVPVLPINAHELSPDDIQMILEQVLYEFPVKTVDIRMPDWVKELDAGHWLRARFDTAVGSATAMIHRLRDIDSAISDLSAFDLTEEVILRDMDLGSGEAVIEMTARPDLFYQVLSEVAGHGLGSQGDLLRYFRVLVYAKNEFDKVEDALREVRSTGYGLVPPVLDDINFEEPEPVRQGPHFGVRLRAAAPSIHMIRADISTEVTPIIGTERQCEELMQYLMEKFEDDPQKLWNTDLFGKPLIELVREGIQNKLYKMPDNVQDKLQETIQRLVNEGSGGLICIII